MYFENHAVLLQIAEQHPNAPAMATTLGARHDLADSTGAYFASSSNFKCHCSRVMNELFERVLLRASTPLQHNLQVRVPENQSNIWTSRKRG
jgi:hypothetical protein